MSSATTFQVYVLSETMQKIVIINNDTVIEAEN